MTSQRCDRDTRARLLCELVLEDDRVWVDMLAPIFDSEISSMVLTSLNQGDETPQWYESQELREHLGHYVPSLTQLNETINTIFWASQTKEEGHATFARVCFCEPKGDGYCKITGGQLTSQLLRKLSPLLDDWQNWIHVDSNNDVVAFGPRNGMFHVSMNSWGQLVVSSYGDTVQAVFEVGQWHKVQRSATDAAHFITAYFKGSFSDGDMQAFATASLASALLTTTRRLRRGAIFAFVAGENPVSLSQPKFAVSFDAAARMFEVWNTMRNDPHRLSFEPAAQLTERSRQAEIASYREVAEKIASSGAGIDGVCVIELPTFSVKGFGAKIKVEKQDDFELLVIEIPKGNKSLKSVTDIGGMRHQSAARLVHAHHETSVFTVSQDGVISLFAWLEKDQKVSMLTHFDRLLIG